MKKSLLLGMAALLSLGFWSSCSSDEPLFVDNTKPLEEDQTFFANIDIRNVDNMSRAGIGGGSLVGDENGKTDEGSYVYDPGNDPGFNKGTAKENEIRTIYLIFYDQEGNRVSTTQVRKDNAEQDDPRYDSENSLYRGVVQIDVKHGQLPPAYVMCFINPITSMNFDINPSFATLDALQQTTRPRIIDDNGLFAMSKSVYYGVNRAREDYDPEKDKQGGYTEADYEKIIATPIAKGQLFTDVDVARKAVADKNNDAILDIYVERYAAKVNLEVDKEAPEGLTMKGQEGMDNATYTLTFVPEYWAVNAYESETYICKSFLDSNLSKDMSYEVMNNALGGEKAWKWNNAKLHRCYWAQTPAYYKAEYPRVADDILDARTEDDMTGGFALGYYSYQEMVDNATGALNAKSRKISMEKNDQSNLTSIYARENTVAGSALQKAYKDPMASPKAAVASAVIVGHYEISTNGGKAEELDPEKDEVFFVSGNATNGYTFYKGEEDMIKYFVNTTVRFAKNQSGTETFYNYGIEKFGFSDPEYIKYFNVEHPSEAVRKLDTSNPAVVDSRFVTIQLNRDEVFGPDAKTLYAYLDGKYQAVTEANFDKVNQQMYFQAGTVQGFKGGKAYFTIPIKHLGFYRDENDNVGKMGTEKNFNWEKVQSGDFGLVRNHIYTIEVETIAGLGNGIPNFDDPIVPPTDPEEYFIGARIIVLNWAVVPTQKVQL